MKKPKTQRPQEVGKPEPVVTHLSETEMVLTYPDGSITRAVKNRPVSQKDGLWLLEMVSTLVPQMQNKKDENDANSNAA